MKRSMIAIMLFTTIFMNGCVGIYYHKCPERFPNTKWVSEEPDMFFEVTEDSECLGQLTIGEQVIQIRVFFNYGSDMTVRDKATEIIGAYKTESGFPVNQGGDELFRGKCNYGKTKFTVTIDKNSDNIFNGTVKKITFVKEE